MIFLGIKTRNTDSWEQNPFFTESDAVFHGLRGIAPGL